MRPLVHLSLRPAVNIAIDPYGARFTHRFHHPAVNIAIDRYGARFTSRFHQQPVLPAM